MSIVLIRSANEANKAGASVCTAQWRPRSGHVHGPARLPGHLRRGLRGWLRRERNDFTAPATEIFHDRALKDRLAGRSLSYELTAKRAVSCGSAAFPADCRFATFSRFI